VSLIDGVRRGAFSAEASAIAHRLAGDRDDMVRKGLGWLLREWGKARPHEAVPLLMDIRPRTSRLVLRTACERLPARERTRILASG
jgi:3-methyladenine DNA glycosylase AlkD